MFDSASMIHASTQKCTRCGTQAAAFFTVACDPDIPAHPYCRKCLDAVKVELMIKLSELREAS